MTTQLTDRRRASCRSTRATMGERAIRPTRRPPHELPVGGGLAARKLAGNPRPLPRHPRDEKKQIKSIIFPRYHQLDATRKLQRSLEEGAGGKFLIQHSAGSGKTNSIAWSAHFLADLHDAKNEKLFSTVIVVSDRNVIDAQLQDALFDFQRTTGVVETIKNEGAQQERTARGGAGGGQEDHRLHHPDISLRARGGARTGGDTGQKFRRDRRRGALLADRRGGSEAEAGAVAGGDCRTGDGGEVSTEDVLAAQMAARASDKGITYRRLHGHTQGQDDGAVRAPPRTRSAGGPRQSARAVPRLFDAAGHRGGLHSRRAEKLHALSGWRSGSRATARNGTTRRSSATRR